MLKNCYNAIPSNGKVIVVDEVVPVKVDGSTATKRTFQIDMVMMTQLQGAKERNQQEILALATAAGFSYVKFDCCVYNFWVMSSLSDLMLITYK